MMSVRIWAFILVAAMMTCNVLVICQEPTVEPEETTEDLKAELNSSKDIRLDELAKVLAEKAKINLVLTHEIDKKINFKLEENVEPLQLLKIVVAAHGYELLKNGNIYTIEQKKEQTTTTTTTPSTTPEFGQPMPGTVPGTELGSVEAGPSYFQLTRVPVEQVESKLREMLSINGKLDVNRQGNAVYVTDNPTNVQQIKNYIEFLNVDPSGAFDARTQQRTFKINHLNPDSIDDMMKKVGSDRTKYLFDRTSMTLVVIDREEVLNSLAQFLNTADQAEPQLFIHCHFIEVEVSAGTNLGTSFSVSDVRIDDTYSDVGFDLSKTDPTSFLNLSSPANNITAGLSATAERKNVRILSSPNLLCYNRQRSSIQMIKEVPFVQSTTDTTGGSGTTTETIEYKEVGISMEVTPEIYSDGTAKLNLKPSVSEVIDYYGKNEVPIIKKKAVESNVIVKNNQVVVIGGLLEDSVQKTRSKVPLLSEIPILGMLFSKEDQAIKKTELIIFLHIILVNDKIIKNMAEAKWQEQENKFQKYDTEFEFYPHMREKFEMEDMNPNYSSGAQSSAAKSKVATTEDIFEFAPHTK